MVSVAFIHAYFFCVSKTMTSAFQNRKVCFGFPSQEIFDFLNFIPGVYMGVLMIHRQRYQYKHMGYIEVQTRTLHKYIVLFFCQG